MSPRACRADRARVRGVRAVAPMAAALLALALSALSSTAVAAGVDELLPFQASYTWLWKGAPVALSRLTFARQQDDVWVYSSASDPRGIGHLYPMRPRLESTLRVTAQAVQPLHFRATGAGSRRDSDVTFDWGAGRATGTYEGGRIDLAVTPGVQDDLSVQIAMMVQLLHGVTPAGLREIDRSGIRDYRYQRVGQETLLTAIGRVDTIIYSSQHPGSPRITRYWCAPSEGYIPMKVQQTRDGSVEWTLTLESLKRG
jgi:Protein of unknown function (DUF3108)